jgi:hypothetical protein
MMDRAFAAALAKPGIVDSLDVPAPLTVNPSETPSTTDNEDTGGEVVSAPSNLRIDVDRNARQDKNGVE